MKSNKSTDIDGENEIEGGQKPLRQLIKSFTVFAIKINICGSAS